MKSVICNLKGNDQSCSANFLLGLRPKLRNGLRSPRVRFFSNISQAEAYRLVVFLYLAI